MRVSRLVIAIIVLATLGRGVQSHADNGTPPTAASLHWLAGTWKSTSQNSDEQIQFMEPLAGLILGASRMVSDNKVAFAELIRIQESARGLVLNPNPLFLLDVGKVGTTFIYSTEKSTAESAVFENPQNVPTTIIYERKDSDGLVNYARNAKGQDLPGTPMTYRKVGN